MALDLFQRKNRELIVAGPQIDMEPTQLKLITSNVVDDTLVTIYTVPIGKTLYISKIMLVANGSPPDNYWRVYIDSDIIYNKKVTFNTTQEIDFPIPMPITTGKAIKERWDKASGTATNYTVIIGWLI